MQDDEGKSKIECVCVRERVRVNKILCMAKGMCVYERGRERVLVHDNI